MIHRIGVISDTHGLVRDEVKEILKSCEVILHGGDIGGQKILDELKTFADVYAVRGNNDREWAKNLPETLSIRLFGWDFFMIHNKKQTPEKLANKDFIIYGHSHIYEERQEGGTTWLNPGSCGPRRFRCPVTMAVIEAGEAKEEGCACQVKRISWQV